MAGRYLLALGLAAAAGASSPTSGCKCLPNGQWKKMVKGMPMIMVENSNGMFYYNASYGSACGKHYEPADSKCFDVKTGMLAASPATYCDEPWCYVDPCTCKPDQIAASYTFPGSNLFYSYTNCGGTAAAATVDTSNCSKVQVPKTMAETKTCSTKFGNGQKRHDSCDGKAVKAKVGGKDFMYPATYGEGCGIHAEPGSSACSDADGKPLASPADWCMKSWSYVNPCECDASDITKGTYFDDVEAWYSYSVCGSTDTYTAGGAATVPDKTVLKCPSPAPPTADVPNPPNWPYTAPAGAACACVAPATVNAAYIKDCTTPWAQGGKCAEIEMGAGKGVMLPANYGATCGVHFEVNSKSCFDAATTMWPAQCSMNITEGCRAGWCDQPWCYVDPNTCKNKDVTPGAHFTSMSYSYSNCDITTTTTTMKPMTVPSSGCKCLENGQATTMNKKGEKVIMVSGNERAASYGSTCGKHLEVGDTNCWDAGNEAEKVGAAAWCSQPWCYVDPCTCDASQITATTVFVGQDLWYSYTNCGGNSTANSVNTSYCKKNPTPAKAPLCTPKFSNGQPQYDSMDAAAYLGKAVMVNMSGKMVHYPANYGEGCGVHMEPGSSACSHMNGTAKPMAEQADWCSNSWSYVNPCECDAADMALSSYFPTAYYSYSVCGSSDTYTSSGASTVDKAAVGCPSPAPPTAAVANPPNWPYTMPGSKPTECACINAIPAPQLKACTKPWAQGGQCAEIALGGSAGKMVAKNYGMMCGVHLEANSASCFDPATEMMWPMQCKSDVEENCRKSWCDDPWCYVDNSTCKRSDVSASAHFAGATYSYGNCNPMKKMDDMKKDDMKDDGMKECKMMTTTTTTTMGTLGSPMQNVPASGCKCMDNKQMKTLSGGKPMIETSSGKMYPTTYGATCGKHIEPGSADCYDMSTGMELKEPKAWCNQPWCYVDPCTCSPTDIAESYMFPGQSLFYSYSNCAGDAKAATVDTSNCSKVQKPITDTKCSVKFNNAAPKFKSMVPWAHMGMAVSATVGGKVWTYPANYGEGCGIHAEPGSSDCSNADGTPKKEGAAAWCKDSWSYVNPCSCDASDIAKGSYFGQEVWYSYSVCGSKDTYTAGGATTTPDKAKLGCFDPAPPAATVQNPPVWPQALPVTKPPPCACLPLPADAIKDCTKPWAQGGKCAEVMLGDQKGQLIPANYGTTCGTHFETGSASCFDPATGAMWPSVCMGSVDSHCRKAWCDSPWCYVDPSTCSGDVTLGAHFTGLHYSYNNCDPLMAAKTKSNGTKSNGTMMGSTTPAPAPPVVAVATQIKGLDFAALEKDTAKKTAVIGAVEDELIAESKKKGIALIKAALKSTIRAATRRLGEDNARRLATGVFVDTEITAPAGTTTDSLQTTIADASANLATSVTTAVKALPGIDSVTAAGATIEAVAPTAQVAAPAQETPAATPAPMPATPAPTPTPSPSENVAAGAFGVAPCFVLAVPALFLRLALL